ncbi:hypothetical protein NKI09_04855 [Mesorhizobium sp. M0757]|uniref:hypothetical protein n=1 Tax=Mesorhizobium sp. M0757 TaxID=2956993 RepID=UPI00333ACC48
MAELFANLYRFLARTLATKAQDCSLFSQGLLNVVQFGQLPLDRTHLGTMRLEAAARKPWFDRENEGCPVGAALLGAPRFLSCSTEHDAAAKVPSVWSSQLVKDTAPKVVVVRSAVEMCLQSAVRHGGRRFQPIEFDRSLNRLISVDEVGNLHSSKISALRPEPPWTKYSQPLMVDLYDPLMATLRYDVRREPDGTLTVFDVFTGQPAIVAGPSVDLPDMEYAKELADILNANDLKQRLSHGRFPGGFA